MISQERKTLNFINKIKMKLVYFYKELKSMSPYRQMGEGMAELRSILHSYKHRKIR